ncbi:MAG: TetR/AcrR family transcriptional regulator [Sphingomonadales bacterium]|nr:TetR/AcrR family transcriptional regulator [Sphingomonadales bacterium]
MSVTDLTAPAEPSPGRSPELSSELSPRVRHLLAAARAAFIAQGYGGVSIDALARDAGVSKETIYRHFADKQALFRAALDDLAAEFAARTAALHAAAPSPGAELAGLARAVLDAALEGGLLSPFQLAAGVAGTMPAFAEELQALQWVRMEPVRRVLEGHVRQHASGGRRPAAAVPLSLALDFGSLAVGGPALLLGFPPLAVAERDRHAARVATLFGEGVLAWRGRTVRDGAVASPQPAPQPAPRPAPQPAPMPATSPAKAAPHIRALLDVAARHFLTVGYEGASLLEIGSQARVGRGTLYRHFSSKAGLFAAVMDDLAGAVAAAARVPRLPAPGADEAALVDGLTDFVAAALETLGGDRSLALHRAAMAAAPRDPALARAVHDAVRAPWRAELEPWLAALVGPDEAGWAAGALLVLAVQGNRLVIAGRVLTASEATAHARRMARLFLLGYARAMAAESIDGAQV